jgi:hypothetical protein
MTQTTEHAVGRDLSLVPIDPREEPFMSATRLGEVAGVSYDTACRWIRLGQVQGVMGGPRSYRINTLVWLRSQGYDL